MDFSDHFSSIAANYAAFRPTYPDELFTWLASLTPKHDLAWDCACGSGQASRGLARHFAHVIATDASAEQLKAATPDPKVEYRVAVAENAELPDRCADIVTVAQAAHWLKLDTFYAEARRVLKPGGVLALWTYEGLSLDDQRIMACIADYEKIVAPYWPPERVYVTACYRTLPFPFPQEIMPPAMRMEIPWSLGQLTGYFRSWSANIYCKEKTGTDPVDGLEQKLSAIWGDPQLTRRVTFPVYMRVARV